MKIVYVVATILPFILYAVYIVWLTTSYHGESTIEHIFGYSQNFLSIAFEIIFYIVCCIFAAALTYFMSLFVASCCAVLFDIEFPDGDYMINILPYIVLIGAIVPAIVSLWF